LTQRLSISGTRLSHADYRRSMKRALVSVWNGSVRFLGEPQLC
jgi:hypothetical protein